MNKKITPIYHWRIILTFYCLAFPLLFLIIGLVIFFVIKFFILETDYTASILIVGFTSLPICIILNGRKYQAFSRFFLRYRFEDDGIYCYGLGWKAWKILWTDICSYAVIGLNNHDQHGGFIALSTNPHVNYTKNLHIITIDKIVLQANRGMWNKIRSFFPCDVRCNFDCCFSTDKDGYFKRKKTGDGSKPLKKS